MSWFLNMIDNDNRWAPLFHAALAFLLSRCAIILTSYIGSALFNLNEHHRDISELFCQWDCGWYRRLIETGYDIIPNDHGNRDAANWAFFPLFPLLSNLTSRFFSTPYLISAYIVSNVSFFIALIFFYKYAALSLSKNQTLFATYLLAFFPYSFYFSVPYTEGLFILLLIAVFYFAATRRWLIAGIAAALLSATRNLGVFIVFPMLIIAIQQFGLKKLFSFQEDAAKAAFAIVMAPLGLFLYMFYLYQHMGDPLAFAHVQIAWERTIGNPFKNLSNKLLQFTWPGTYLASIGVATLIIGALLVKIKRYSEGVITMILILIPASTSMASLPRYSIVVFPIYIYMALIAKSQWVKYILLGSAALLNSLLVLAWITAQNFMT